MNQMTSARAGVMLILAATLAATADGAEPKALPRADVVEVPVYVLTCISLSLRCPRK